jgi:hypothetical protein
VSCCPGPYPALLQPPLDVSPYLASLHHQPKIHASTLSGLDCPLIRQQKPLTYESTTCAAALELLLSSGKPDHPVWGSRLSSFPVLGPSCPVAGRHPRNGHLRCISLCGQNLQLVLTISDGSALAMEPRVRTTLPKVDKEDTSSTEAPRVPTLVARLGSKAPDDTPFDGDPSLLNFAAVVSWIVCWTKSLLQRYRPDPGKPNGPVFVPLDAGPAFSVFSHEDVKSGFWTRLWHVSLILLPSASFWIFGLDHPRLSLFSYDNLLSFGRLNLRWLNHDLFPLELDYVHVSWEQIFVELHLRILCKF